MTDFKKALNHADVILKQHIDVLDIVLIAQVMTPRGHDNPLQLNCSETEYFTVQEFNEIYQGIVGAGFYIRKVFFSEIELIEDIVASPKEYSSTIVFNLCRNGVSMNKKTVIPAVCDLLGIKYTSSGSAQCALARNKWMFTCMLKLNNINCPASGLGASELANQLPHSTQVICKPVNGSASQGINEQSITTLEEAITRCNTEVLVQEYIDGYECEVPVFCTEHQCFAMAPVGIRFNTGLYNSGIVSDQSSQDNDYEFYPLSTILPKEVCRDIMDTAERTFLTMNLQKYGRIDFRIDKNTLKHYVMDISTTPYLTLHSSFAFAVNQQDGSYNDIYRLIIAAALLESNYLDKNCKSDNR